MNDAQKTALASSLLSGALGILLTATIGFLIRRATLARRREEWLQSGQVGLASAMIGDQRIEQLGNSILEFLARYLGAVAGVLFVSGSEDFRRASTYGVPKNADIPTQFKRREGLLGQAAMENRPLHIGEVPEGYLAFGSALGQDKPKHLAILPGSIDGVVNSVIELGFFRPIDERVIALPGQASASVAYRGAFCELSQRASKSSRRNPTAGGGIADPERGAARLERRIGGARPGAQGISSAARTAAGRTRTDEFATGGADPSSWRRNEMIWSGPMPPSNSRRGNWSRRADTNQTFSPTCRTSCERRSIPR